MGRQDLTEVSRQSLSGPRGAGDNGSDAVWGLVHLPEKIELLGPDLADVGGEFGCFGGCVDICGDTVADCPVGHVSHLQCLVLIHFLVDGCILQMLVAFSHVILGVHHHQTTAFVCLSDGEVLVEF